MKPPRPPFAKPKMFLGDEICAVSTCTPNHTDRSNCLLFWLSWVPEILAGSQAGPCIQNVPRVVGEFDAKLTFDWLGKEDWILAAVPI